MSPSNPPPAPVDPSQPEERPTDAAPDAVGAAEPASMAPEGAGTPPSVVPAAVPAAPEPPRAPRVHDVRSPRISRSTTDSRRFYDASRAPAEARPARGPRSNDPRDREPRRFAVEAPTRAPGVPRGVVPGASIPEPEAAPPEPVEVASRAPEQPARRREPMREPIGEPIREPKPQVAKPIARVQSARPAPAEEVAAPPPPDPVQNLRALTAPRVSLGGPPKKSKKPQTAKEAMAARALAQGARGGRAKAVARGESSRRGPAARAARGRVDAQEDVAPDSDAAAPSTPTSDAAPARVGLWQKVKRFFGG